MAGLRWVAVALAFFLSAGNSSAAVDQNWLTSIVEGIKTKYTLGDTFSLAVNVPQNQDPNNLQQVFQDDPVDQVIQTVSQGQVYQGTRVVAAAQSEALSQVLGNIQPFIKSNEGNFLVIYSEESPCGPTCTTNANEGDIASKINDVTQNWSGYAFVFSKVLDVPGADTSQLGDSFKQLGISKLGLDNIFRCYTSDNNPFQCTSCSSGGDVTPSCVVNSAPSYQEQDVGKEMAGTVPPGEDIGAVTDKNLITGTGEGTGGRRKKEKGRQPRRCKGRKGGCKRRRGGKRGKGGKVKKQRRRGKGKGRVKSRGRKGKGKRGKKGGRRKSKRRGGRKRKGRRRGFFEVQ